MRELPPYAVTVLTAVTPGREEEMAHHLELLRSSDLPFPEPPGAHLLRWTLVGQPPAPVEGHVLNRETRMRYLLLTAVSDDPARRFFEGLRTTCGEQVDMVWHHCVGYPGHRNRRLFHSYVRHNSLRAQQTFNAWTATVPEVRGALELRRRHLRLALALQQAQGGQPSDRELRERFQDVFPEGT